MKNEFIAKISNTLEFSNVAMNEFLNAVKAHLTQNEPREVISDFLTWCPEGTAVECFDMLQQIIGQDELIRLIADQWNSLNENQKLLLGMITQEGQLLSQGFWLDVFADPSNSVLVRHRIVAGISLWNPGLARERMVDLINAIGDYDNENQQSILRRFKSNALSH